MGLAPNGHNSVLFDFESLFDYRVGSTLILKKYFKDSDMLDKHFLLGNNKESLIKYHLAEGDPFKRSFINNLSDEDLNSLIEDIKDKYIDELFLLSPKTIMHRLLKTFLSNDGIRCKVLINQDPSIRNSYREKSTNYINGIKNGIGVRICKREEVNKDEFGRFIIDCPKHALEYGVMDGKSITLLNYKENFIVNNNSIAPTIDIVIFFGDTNKIEFVNSYSDNILLPEG